MPKVTGEAPHVFIVEESSNDEDWSIVTMRKTPEAAELFCKRYEEEVSTHVRMVVYDRGQILRVKDSVQKSK